MNLSEEIRKIEEKSKTKEDCIKNVLKNGIAEQDNIINELTCPICHNHNVEDVVVSSRDLHILKYAYIKNLEYNLKEKFCTKCGYVMLFVDFKK